MRHQLEFDLVSMSNEKRARKNALRRRVTSSPTSAATAPSDSASQPPSTVEIPGMESSASSGRASSSHAAAGSSSSSSGGGTNPSAELRRLVSGQTSDGWDVTVNAPVDKPKQRRRAGEGKRDAGKKGAVGGAIAGGEGDAVEGAGVLRNHDWVMERVKMRKREESRVKRERFAKKDSAIWSPSMEQASVV